MRNNVTILNEKIFIIDKYPSLCQREKPQHIYLNTIRICKNKQEVQHEARKYIWDNSSCTGLLLLARDVTVSALSISKPDHYDQLTHSPDYINDTRVERSLFKMWSTGSNWMTNIHSFPFKPLCHLTGKGSAQMDQGYVEHMSVRKSSKPL